MKSLLTSFSKVELRILSLGIICLVMASIFSEGYYHLDEHYQILEFASSYLGLTKEYEMPWEWHEQMRPSFQPWIAITVHKILYGSGDTSPFHVAFVLRLLSAGLALFTTLLLHRSFSHFYEGWQKKWLLAFGFFVWFMPYLMVRFSSENWGAMLFFIGLSLSFSPRLNTRKWLLIGLLLALSFYVRFQMVFAIMGLIGYLFYSKKITISSCWSILTGVIFGLTLMISMDCLYYDAWVFTPWNYFEQNILLDKAATFGVDPWWMYFGWFFDEARMPISLLIFYGVYLLYKRKSLNVFSWIWIPFLLGHFIVGHKELRFLFPMVYLIPFALTETTTLLAYFKNKRIFKKVILIGLGVMNLGLLLYACFMPAKSFVRMYQHFNSRIEQDAVVFAAAHYHCDWTYGLHYYMPDDLNYIFKDTTQLLERINDKPHYIYFKTSQKEQFLPYLGDSITATIPNWVYSFNYNGWVNRESNYVLYEFKEKGLSNDKIRSSPSNFTSYAPALNLLEKMTDGEHKELEK